MDRSGRTFRNTLLAKLALCKVDICEIILYSDRLERTDLRALAASDAGSLAGLAGSGSLVLVHA